ncbi:hypothetical protein P885DRAFT_75011 [Corynascus similis CBS 632.67]
MNLNSFSIGLWTLGDMVLSHEDEETPREEQPPFYQKPKTEEPKAPPPSTAPEPDSICERETWPPRAWCIEGLMEQ